MTVAALFKLKCFICLFYSQNSNVTWNTDDPEFTKCFQRTVLIWVPCAFLWLFSFLDIFYIRNSFNRDIPRSYLNVTKLILTAALIVLSFIDLIVAIVNQSDRDVYPVDYYTPAIKIATFVSLGKLLILEQIN